MTFDPSSPWPAVVRFPREPFAGARRGNYNANRLWFLDISLTDAPQFGGKGANLGELTQAGFPVPAGFVVSAGAFLRAMGTVYSQELREQAGGPATTASSEFEALSTRLRQLVRSARGAAGHPRRDHTSLRAARHRAERRSPGHRRGGRGNPILGGRRGQRRDVVRRESTKRSPTPPARRGGEPGRRLLGVGLRPSGDRLPNRQGRVASAAIGRRRTAHGPRRPGVAFSVDPVTQDRYRLMIEAAWGQGEVVVGGLVRARYLRGGSIDQIVARVARPRLPRSSGARAGGTNGSSCAPGRREEAGAQPAPRCCSSRPWSSEVADPLRPPQDVEFAIDQGGRGFVVQSRPITTLTADVPTTSTAGSTCRAPVVVSGLGCWRLARNSAIGQVRLLARPRRGPGRLEAGEILVAPMTEPDWVPTMRRAGAVVTDSGGMTCHAAIVSRELGVPASSALAPPRRCCATASWSPSTARAGGARRATRRRLARQRDGRRRRDRRWSPAPSAAGVAAEALATQLYVNLAVPDAGRGGRRAARRRRRAAAGRVHDHRGARRQAPAQLLAEGGGESSSTRWRRRCCDHARRSRPARSCIAPTTSGPTSSAASTAATSSSRTRRTR